MSQQQDSILLLQTPKQAISEVQLPQYYEQIFFSGDTLLHPEATPHFGVAGDPVPYVVRNDNLITGLLLLCFILTLVVLAHFRYYLAGQFRSLLLVPRAGRDEQGETPLELRIKCLLTLQSCLLFGIVVYFLTHAYVATTFIIDSDYQLIFIFMGMILVYGLLKNLFYTIVNCVFFDGKRNQQFLSMMLLVTATQGLLVFPLVLLLVYFGISYQSVLYFFAFVVFLGKIMAFYRAYLIFFRQNGGFLQIILYFCALEIVPLAVLVGTWAMTVDLLKINF